MNPLEQLKLLKSEISEKLKKISDNVNNSNSKDVFSQISLLVNVTEELDDVLLNWDDGQLIPDRLIQFFKNQDDFDFDEDED
jgi:hypothetical protein